MSQVDPKGAAHGLTHIDKHGAARMVDVGDKPITRRRAVAEGLVRMGAEALAAARVGSSKGDVLQVARIAGIQGAKRCADLVPLCHPLPLTRVEVHFELEDEPPAVRVRAIAECAGRTGVEMEALTAASVAALTVYDMLKAVDRAMVIGGLRLLEKEGGRSGSWRADANSGNFGAEALSTPTDSGAAGGGA